MKKVLSFALKLLVSGSLLSIFLSKVNILSVVETLKKTQVSFFITGCLVYMSILFILTKRWSLFLPDGLNYLKLLSLYFVGSFFDTFLPGLVGGDAVKAYYLYNHTGKGGPSIAAVFMDRYVGFVAMACIALIAYAIGYSFIRETEVTWIVSVFLGGLLLASIILWKVNWGRIKFLGDLYSPLMGYKSKKGIILQGLLLGLVVQCIGITNVYILSKSIGLNVPILYFFVFVPIIAAASAVPVSIAGLGIREAGYVILFSKAGLSSAEALSLSLLVFTVRCLVSMIGGIEYLRIGWPVDRK